MAIINFQHLRGNTAKNDAYKGLPGEITINTDTNVVRVHDGQTVGGNGTKDVMHFDTMPTSLPKDVRIGGLVIVGPGPIGGTQTTPTALAGAGLAANASTGKLDVALGEGLTLNTSTGRIDASGSATGLAGTGLTANAGTGKIDVNIGSGLSINTSTGAIEANGSATALAGDGLVDNSGKLAVKADTAKGITIDSTSKSVGVNAGDGLKFDTNGKLAVDVSAVIPTDWGTL